MLLPPLLSELGVEVGEERKIDLVDCQKYLATYAYLEREREEFTRITRVLNAHLDLNGPFLRDVYLGSSHPSSIKYFTTVYIYVEKLQYNLVK